MNNSDAHLGAIPYINLYISIAITLWICESQACGGNFCDFHFKEILLMNKHNPLARGVQRIVARVF